MIGWRFEEATFAILMALYQARGPLAEDELAGLAFEVAADAAFVDAEDPSLRKTADQDVSQLLAQLALLGVVELDHGRAGLTPLGVAAFAGYLRRQLGATVPVLQDLFDETAEVVVAHAADAPQAARDELLTGWRRHNPDTATPQLLALAARTDDREHRKLAEAYARR
ncbi:hypothetical protein AB0M46_01795 [Dactylosporangium sp. NPDC051485]|uniref:hypothetical protein n=1 Tax=Dactylosporangium sp. NPDC051485 TaxID=3154846 RepID=UPI0034417E84